MALGDFLNKAKDAANNLKDVAANAVAQGSLLYDQEVEQLNKLTNVGTDKVKAIFIEVLSASDIIAEAGYELDEIELVLSVPPKVIPHFLFKEAISEKKKLELTERTKGNKLMNLLLKSLFKASSLQSSLGIGNFRMFEVEIEIGLIPSLKLKFSKRNLTSQKILSNK